MRKLSIKGCTEQPLVAVVLVNYNGLADTRECLLSLRDVEYKNMAVIVVDNASQDGSLEILRNEFPEVDCIRSDRNLGFTGGNNMGLAKAYELSPDYVFLLNNDTVVSPSILSELIGFMESHADVGLAGPLNCYYDAKDVVSFSGGFLNRNSGLVCFLYKGAKRGDIREPVIYCNFIEGAALFIRTEIIKKIGGLNDLYFLTSEESELCARVSDLGFRQAVLVSCCIWHKVSQAMGAESELANYFIFRNKLWFIKRNATSRSFTAFLPIVGYITVCLLSFSIKKRNFAAARGIITGIFDYLRGIGGAGRYKERLNA